MTPSGPLLDHGGGASIVWRDPIRKEVSPCQAIDRVPTVIECMSQLSLQLARDKLDFQSMNVQLP